MVGRRDGTAALLSGEASKSLIAEHAGIGLVVARKGLGLNPVRDEGEVQRVGESPSGIRTPARLCRGSHVVFDMGDDDAFGLGRQGEHERRGIRPAGTGDQRAAIRVTDPSAAREPPPGGQHLLDRGVSFGGREDSTARIGHGKMVL